MIMKPRLALLFILVLLYSPAPSKGQDRNDDIVKVRTRVVFVDTLVQEKKTGAPVADLTRENFEVLADGKPRTLSYFSRAGEAGRRPLALILVFDMVAGYTDEGLRQAGILESLTAALKRLPPEDEVAVLGNLGGTGAPLKTLTDFTRDRTKMAEALFAVRSLPSPQPRLYSDEVKNILQMAERAAAERPQSQIIVVPVTCVFAPMAISERDKITAGLIRANVFFSPLTSDPGKGHIRMSILPGKYPTPPRPIFETIGFLVRWDNYSPEHLAQQTGGEAAKVGQPEDYAVALEKLIASLAARYNLGFTLKENERDDGRMHKLEVRVKARDLKGKERKLVVRARRGYFMKMQEVPVAK